MTPRNTVLQNAKYNYETRKSKNNNGNISNNKKRRTSERHTVATLCFPLLGRYSIRKRIRIGSVTKIWRPCTVALLKLLRNRISLVQNPHRNLTYLVSVPFLPKCLVATRDTDETFDFGVPSRARHLIVRIWNCQIQTLRASGSMSMCGDYSHKFHTMFTAGYPFHSKPSSATVVTFS